MLTLSDVLDAPEGERQRKVVRSCGSALSPVASGSALTHAGWWSRIFTAAVDRTLERRFVPATRPHTTESSDGSVELNAFEGATVGTRTRVNRRHALSGCSSAAIPEHRIIIVCKSDLFVRIECRPVGEVCP